MYNQRGRLSVRQTMLRDQLLLVGAHHQADDHLTVRQQDHYKHHASRLAQRVGGLSYMCPQQGTLITYCYWFITKSKSNIYIHK